MDIAELKALQTACDLSWVHVVELRSDGFTIAHTDQERATKADGFILEDCPLHRWLVWLNEPPRDPGIYAVSQDGSDWRPL